MGMNGEMKPPDFIVCAPPKTGSTLLTRLLTQHPQVTSSHESYLLMPGRDDSICTPGSDKAKWHNLSPEQSEYLAKTIAPGTIGALRETLCAVADHMRQWTGCPVAGESWPMWSMHIHALQQAVPESLLLVAVRDPRAVWWSSYSYPREGMPHHELARLANGQLGCLEEMDRHLAPGYRGVVSMRAEDYAGDVEGMTRSLWRVLGVDPDEGWFAYRSDLDISPHRWDWIVGGTSQPDPSRMDRWVGQIPEPACRSIEQRLGSLIQSWGYEPTAPARRTIPQYVADFCEGAPLSELPEGMEDQIRVALNHARSAVDADIQEASSWLDALDEQYAVAFDDIGTDEWRMAMNLCKHWGITVAANGMRHLLSRMTARVQEAMTW